MRVSRAMILVISIIGIAIAWNENSVIFEMLFSLFWKRVNRPGAIAGMLSGGIMVFVWKLLLKPLGGVFAIYELLPAFIISCIVIVVVSLCTAKPSDDITTEFDKAKNFVEE